jgi:hypothetical protein
MDAVDQRSGVMPSFSARSMIGVPWVSSAQTYQHLVAAHLLEAHPDVGLDVLDQVAEVDRAVGIGQGAGNEDLAEVGLAS